MWNATLSAYKICSGSCSLTAAVNAIDYGVQNGVRVSNNSWGGGGRSQALQDAINRAGQAGVLFVAAAGNNGRNIDASPFYPCNFGVEGSDNVICAAASTSSDGRAGFSNYGVNSVHVAAPGSGVLSTLRGARYGNMSGTSMAAPHVTGLVGLILSKNPNLSPADVKDIIVNSVRSVPAWSSLVIAGGIIDVGASLNNTP